MSWMDKHEKLERNFFVTSLSAFSNQGFEECKFPMFKVRTSFFYLCVFAVVFRHNIDGHTAVKGSVVEVR